MVVEGASYQARIKKLHNSYELATSVVGIGFDTAVHFIIATENFTRFENVRKLICYCGVAPSKHESAISIRGRTRVSPLANNIIIVKLIERIFTVVKRGCPYDRPSQGAATVFAVSDDLKQQVSKFQGTIFTIIYKGYILIYNPAPSS